jgi:hypothetical protein
MLILAFGVTYVTGDEGIRTLDLRIANATLSQLSYVPEYINDITETARVKVDPPYLRPKDVR